MALADGVLEILADAPRRERLAVAGRVRARERFSMEQMLSGYVDLYR
jgi:hypothetical protein